MSKLNAPREIPYDFRVVEYCNVAWILDWSELTYPCTPIPHIYMEPLYATVGNGDDDYLGDGTLFLKSDIEPLELVVVPMDDEDIAPDIPPDNAWDAAREEAMANHLI
tara:strand:- start:1638 stop:1961 length:324 start_codon:yes stop_codon:yes gene_type:complete